MKILYILLVVFLSGCSWLQPRVVTKIEYVTRSAPPEMYELDQPVTYADLTTQKGIAQWLVKSELRMKQCENKLDELQRFYNVIP